MNKITLMPEVKALIFDCDGTLADSMPFHMLAWKIALEDFGEVYREDFLDPLKGMNEEEIVFIKIFLELRIHLFSGFRDRQDGHSNQAGQPAIHGILGNGH